MLILADENFPLPTVEAMRAVGHDVLWARTKCPGRADAALLERNGSVPFLLQQGGVCAAWTFAVGHDVLWARTKCPGRADAALLERKGDRPIFRMPLRDQPGCRKGFTISSGQRTARPGRSSE